MKSKYLLSLMSLLVLNLVIPAKMIVAGANEAQQTYTARLSNKDTSRCHEAIYRNFKALTKSMASAYEPVNGRALTNALKRCESESSKSKQPKLDCLRGAREVALKAKDANNACSPDFNIATILGEEITGIEQKNSASEEFKETLKGAGTCAVALPLSNALIAGTIGAVWHCGLSILWGRQGTNIFKDTMGGAKEGATIGAMWGSLCAIPLSSIFIAAGAYNRPVIKDTIYWKYLK